MLPAHLFHKSIDYLGDELINGDWASPSGRVLTLRAKPIFGVLALRVSPADAFAVAFGDVAYVPQELRPARKMAEGGASEQGGRAVTGQDRTHDKPSL